MILYAILPLSTFFLLGLFLLAVQNIQNGKLIEIRKVVIQTSLFWSAYAIIGTEVLGLFEGVSTAGIALMWGFAMLVLVSLHWKAQTLSIGWERMKKAFANLHLSGFDYISLFVVFLVLLILFITGFLSPPNVHDVLAYHMARVMHWIQNRSLAFFPTSNTLQLWMPTFSEISQLNWFLLWGSDRLAFFPQWYSLILTMVAVSLIAKHSGAERRGQWLSALFLLSLPIIVLQASGSKNDIVLAYCFACLLFFVVQSTHARLDWLDQAACSMSVAIGVLTKGTFAFFALPLLLWLLVTTIKHNGWKNTLAFAGIGLAIVIVINGGHWSRNTLTFGNPLSTGGENSLINGRFGVDVTISNLSRHIAVQMNGRFGLINEVVEKALATIHTWIDLPLFDPEITLGPAEFYYVPNREEVAGNPFHFVLTGFVFLLFTFGLFRKSSSKKAIIPLLLTLSAFLGAIIFSVVFRWQSWSTRLVIPYYVAFAPVFGFVFDKYLPPVASWMLGMVLVILLINPLFNNYSRAFSWSEENRNSIWRLSRKGLLFANNQNIEGAVLELTHLMAQSGCGEFGVRIRDNAPEYLLWATLTPNPVEYSIEHISVDNPSVVHSDPDFNPCGIVLFEVIAADAAIDPEYLLVRDWEIGSTSPFSLYLTPQYNLDGME